jgi:hypothetical protein
VTPSDQYLLDHAAAVNAAIHGLAEAAGLSVDGLPEPANSYTALATMADVLYLREGVQAALIELANRINDIALVVADVASRPPISITVPVPEVNVTVPDRHAVIEFSRDKDGRIVAAESTPVP